MNTFSDSSFSTAPAAQDTSVLVVDFPYQDMVHPARRDVSMKSVVELAKRDATRFGMRVDSLESAQRVIQAASDYSEWSARSYRPFLELIASALAAKQYEALQRSLAMGLSFSPLETSRLPRSDMLGEHPSVHTMGSGQRAKRVTSVSKH
jgi:hypothetical protein